MTDEPEYRSPRVVVENAGWKAMAVLDRIDGVREQVILVLHLLDPDGLRWSDREVWRLAARPDENEWLAWLTRRAGALIAEFSLGLTHPDAAPPVEGCFAGIVRLAKRLKTGSGSAFEIDFPVVELDCPDLRGAYGFAESFGVDIRRGNAAFGYLLRKETAAFSRAFAVHRPWVMACGPVEDLMTRMIDRGLSPDCSPRLLAKVLDGTFAFGLKDVAVTTAAIRAVDTFHNAEFKIHPSFMLRFLSLLPQSWAPRDRDSYEAAMPFCDAIAFGWARGFDERRMRRLLVDCRGDWISFSDRISRLPAARNGIEEAVVDVLDMVRDFSRRIVAPTMGATSPAALVHTAPSMRVAIPVLCEGAGLAEVLRRSQNWHRKHRGLPGLNGSSLPWGPLLPPSVLPEGVEIVFLKDLEELVEEGIAMDHCVASYAGSCMTGKADVASVRQSDGTRLSTLEIVVRDGGAVVAQHRGRGNSAPPDEAVAAVARWREDLDGRRIAPRPSIVTRKSDRVVLPAEGSPSNWKGILPDRFASMSWQELFDVIRAMQC